MIFGPQPALNLKGRGALRLAIRVTPGPSTPLVSTSPFKEEAAGQAKFVYSVCYLTASANKNEKACVYRGREGPTTPH